MKSNSIKTPLKRVEGLGSAHHGVHHWIMLRSTAVALIPLSVWFVVNLIILSKSDFAQLLQFFKSPVNALLMALLVVFSFYHAALGLREVVEDYVHRKFKKSVTILFINLALLALGTLTVMAIAKMHFFS